MDERSRLLTVVTIAEWPVSRSELKEKAALLRELHHRDAPLVLPNVWDVASARRVEDASFPVVATSSWAVAASLGYDDEDCMPPDEAFGVIGRVAQAVAAPVTGDIEAGYGLDANEIVERLLAAGAVGCNFEDTDHHGGTDLVEIDRQTDRIAAIRRAAEESGVPIVVNARVDVSLEDATPTADGFREAVARARAYLAAGADSVYPIRLADESMIGEFVERVESPVNIMFRPDGLTLGRLAELGVARVSLAAGLMRSAYGALEEALLELRAQWRRG